ncbi:2-Hydroxyacid oxidase 1-like isoform X1 [Apostichopus japonicus]|uniref:2-Hydroxyacid oxidase 1-like isoform X1 n=1 Tax=Stichopus japonicus TaxID=307972 RepID=UPI003AB7144B
MAASNTSLICVNDYEKAAKGVMKEVAWAYFSSAADEETTFNECPAAYKRYYLIPRILRPVEERTLSTTVLGKTISFPVCISPTAYHKFAHPEGEKATSKAAKSCDTLMILSSIATTRLEDVAEVAPDGLRWMQSYMFRDKQLFEILVRRAEASGYKAMVLTVDDPREGKRYKTIPYGYVGLYETDGMEMANLDVDIEAVRKAEATGDKNLTRYGYEQSNSYATWNYVKWAKTITNLPIVVKGVISPASAREAVEAGVHGILVSVHGGRQLDGLPPPHRRFPLLPTQWNLQVQMFQSQYHGNDHLLAVGLTRREGAKHRFMENK